MSKIKFSLSPSSINLYHSSQLLFYYGYILKSKPDTIVKQCYGDAGNVVHETLEQYSKNNKIDFEKMFEADWSQRKLDTKLGFNYKPLDKTKNINAFVIGKQLLDSSYLNPIPEEAISFDIYEDDTFKIRNKGIIDIQCEFMGSKILVDWKTSSKVDKGEGFKRQGLHYCMLVYKKYGYVPDKIVFEYLKINKKTIYTFTKEDILNYEKEVHRLCKEIVGKGTDINNYDIGIIDSPFNAHLIKCKKERERRETSNIISADLKDNKLIFGKIPKKLYEIMVRKYSYFVQNYEHNSLFKKKDENGNRMWDGKKHLFKDNILPYGFSLDVKRLVWDYNQYYKTNYVLVINDLRNQKIVNRIFDTKFKEQTIIPRYYQNDCVEVGIRDMAGIFDLGTGGGKTLIAGLMGMKLNRLTLVLVNRTELVTQSKESFEKLMGVNIATMSEGNMDVSSQFTVASVQTLSAILRRNDETSDLLKLYLYNVTCVFYDEAQNLKDPGMYSEVSTHLVNNVYCIGLSGSPWRNDGATLEMNSMVGFPIYNKPTWKLEAEGFLVPTKCYFIQSITDVDVELKMVQRKTVEIDTITNRYFKKKKEQTKYLELSAEMYDEFIVDNDKRNNMIAELVNKYSRTKKILVLTRRKAHADILEQKINNVLKINNSVNMDYRKQMFKEFKNTRGIVLVGSIQIFSAGVDIPDLDIIVDATGHKSTTDTAQVVGRPKRLAPGKTMSYFIDFNDTSRFLREATKERKRILTALHNEIIDVDFVEDVKIE